MRIGIFSKYEMCGGSELRCLEMANAISRYTDHTSVILCEKALSKRLSSYKSEEVEVVENIFLPDPHLDALYSVDSLLIVNTDNKDFSKLDYWEGKTSRHDVEADISRIPQMVFLYNFLISPSQHLHTVAGKCSDVRILTTNRKFFNEITEQDRYERVRHLPRMILESPINTNSISSTKTECDRIRIGRHSLSAESKFNKETIDLIKMVNKKYLNKIQWDFMGVPGRDKKELQKFSNVTVRKEFSMPVPDYLNSIDVFLFFVSWSREEPWSRAVGEAIASGCPVLATDRGGNRDQVVHGNNGFLCKETKSFYEHIVYLVGHPEKIREMGRNSSLYSEFFSSDYIIKKFVRFIESHGDREGDREGDMKADIDETIESEIETEEVVAGEIKVHNEHWGHGVKKRSGKNWRNLFDKAESEAAWISKGHLDFFTHILTGDVLIKIGKPLHDLTCLEIGVGGGRLALAAGSVFKTVYGIDIHDDLNRTEEWLRDHNCDNVILLNDIAKIEDESIYYVYSYITFQHFAKKSQIDNYLEHISRILTPGGVASICYVNTDSGVWERDGDSNVGVVSLKISNELMEKTAKDFGLSVVSSSIPRKYPWSSSGRLGQQTMLVLCK